MKVSARCLRFVLLAGSLILAPGAWAQRGGPPGGGGMPGGGGPPPMGGGMPPGGNGSGPPRNGDGSWRGNGGPPPGNSPDAAATTSTMRGGLQLGPPGRWWDDKHFAKNLGLRSDQQRRMDAIFEENRPNLLRRYETLQLEQTRMEEMTRGKSLDETGLFAQIDRLAQARAELEKANTHLLLKIRGEMDGEQIARLEQHR